MKLALALGLGACGLATAALAQPADHPGQPDHQVQQRVIIQGGAMDAMMDLADLDTNHDGWLSRDEAAAGADRMFARLDTNHDGKLDQNDQPPTPANLEVRSEPDGHGGSVIHMGDGQDIHIEHGANDVHIETHGGGDHETRTIIVTNGPGEAHVEGAPPPPANHSDTVERNVIVIRTDNSDHDGDRDHIGPHAMHMMHAPMALMMFASSEEADVNGDGALSQEEFRNMQLRFFDAADVNGDHKIRLHLPDMAPPPPPPAPTPPASPPPARH